MASAKKTGNKQNNSGLNMSRATGVDEQLLSRNKKKEKRKKQVGNQDGRQSADFREAVQRKRIQKRIEEQVKRRKASKMAKAATAPIRKGTSGLLRSAWANLVSSFGLTLIWINLHVFLGSVFGNNFFCKLGAEWMDGNIKQAQFDKAKQEGGIAGNIEGMGLACLNMGCLLILLAVFTIIAMTLNVIANPLEALSDALGALWGALTG